MGAHPVEALLEAHRASDNFKHLVEKGCNREELLSLLHLIHEDWPGFDTWETRTGMDRKRARTAIKRFHDVADEVERINKSGFGMLLIPPSRNNSLLHLPQQLRLYAELLDRPPGILKGAKHPVLHIYKYSITHHVVTFTRDHGFHDEDVSALIDACLPDEKRPLDRKHGGDKTYDAPAHAQWRRTNYATIEKLLRSQETAPEI